MYRHYGMSKRTQKSFFVAHPGCNIGCHKRFKIYSDVLQCIRKCMKRGVKPMNRNRGWYVYLNIFYDIAADTKNLITEKRIKFVCRLPDLGGVYRVYDKDETFTIFSNRNQCECRVFKLICAHDEEITCQHVLACAIVDDLQLVEQPAVDRVAYYLGLPTENPNRLPPVEQFWPAELDEVFEVVREIDDSPDEL